MGKDRELVLKSFILTEENHTPHRYIQPHTHIGVHVMQNELI